MGTFDYQRRTGLKVKLIWYGFEANRNVSVVKAIPGHAKGGVGSQEPDPVISLSHGKTLQ